MFEDRADAGERLAEALRDLAETDGIVLGIARGGVIVGLPVARALGFPLDVVVPRKLGAPGNPELGLGAVAPGVRVIDEGLVERLRVSDSYLEREIAAQEMEIERRMAAYRGDAPPPRLDGRVAIVVDDGVATGGTALAAIRWAQKAGAGSVVFAAPVGPPTVVARLEGACDRVVVLETPAAFMSVGDWYRRFDQVSDAEVVAALGPAP
jgi:putative phosphoribosyl transferase